MSSTDILDVADKHTVVTGGNIGLGFRTSLELAANGARVTIACRSRDKGEAAAAKILTRYPDACVDTLPLDLLDLASIQAFAEDYMQTHDRLDVLVNNAGVVNLESHTTVWGGHEAHMATNHYGHFALVGQLWPRLLASRSARVVVVSSLAYRQGVIDFDDLAWNSRSYDRLKCYGDSKLANLLFMNSLNRLARKRGANVVAVAAHPGLTGTERQQTIGIGGKVSKWLASPVEKGVRPQLLACSAANSEAGDFLGPRFGLFGPPTRVKLSAHALDEATADRLWQVSEDVTGVRYLMDPD